MESSEIITMHIQSVDQTAAIKQIKHTITELDRSKIEEQKKAVRSGYDMDIIPSDLATYGKDAKALLKELQSQNERMFLVTFLIMNTGKTQQELENNVFQASSIAQKHNCNLRRLDFQQEQGLMFLRDNNIESLEQLNHFTAQKIARRDELLASVRQSEKRLAEIGTLKKHIINYSKTRSIYEEYRKAGYSKKFLEAHREEITIHKAAKAAFDEFGIRKLPKVKELSKEYAEIFSAKKRTYREYYCLKQEVSELVIAQQNINSLYDAERKEKDQLHQKEEQIH